MIPKCGQTDLTSDRLRLQCRSFRPLLRAVRSSVPLFTYLIMTALCLLHIRLPAPVLEFAGIVGNANAFMAMLMIGVGFNIGANREQLLGVLRTLGPRYLIGLALIFVPLPVMEIAKLLHKK